MAPKPFRSAGIGQQSSHQQAILLNGCSGKTGWWGLQHATSKALCQQPVSVPPSQRNTAVSSSTSTASSIGQLQHEGPTSREAAARQQVQPTLSTPKKAGGKRGLEHESKLAKLQRRAEVMKRFEEAVKATSEKQELKDLMAQHAKQVRKLDPGEIVLVCNQMAKLCDPQRMPWRAWKEVQGWATQMLALLDPSLEQLSTFELVVLLAALARMNYSPSAEWLAHYFDVTMPRIPNCGPGHLTLMLRALSRLEAGLWELKEAPNFKHWMQRMLDNAHSRLRSFKGRELVHLLQALADIKWMPSQAWLASYSAIFRRRLDLLDPPMISTAMLAFATLKYDPGIPLAHAMYTNMATNLPLFEAKDLATTAQAIATIRKRLQRREFLDGFMSEVLQKLPTFGAKHLANLLHALATLVSQGLIRPNTATYPVGAPQLQPQSPLLQQPPPSPRQQQQQQQQQERQQQEQQQQQEQREVHLQQQIRLQQAEASQAAQQRQQPDLQQQQQQQQSMELGQQSKLLDGTRVASNDVSQPSVGSGSSAEHVHFKQSSSGLGSTEDSRKMRSGHTGMGTCPQPSADVGAFSLSASSSSSNSKNSNSSEAQGSANGRSNRNTSAQGSETGSDSPSSSSSRADSGCVVKSGGSIDWSRSSIDWSRSSIDWSSGSVDWSASSIDESSSRSKTLHDGPSSRVGGGPMRVARPTRHAPPEDMSSSSSSSSSSSNGSSTDGAASPAPVNPVQPSPASSSPTLPATTQSAPIGVPSNTASSSSSPSADRNLEGGDSSSSSSNSGGPSPVHVPAAAGPSPPLASPLPFQLPRAVVWTTVPPIPGSPSSGPVRLPAPTLTWLDAAAHRVHALMPDTNGGTLATAVWGLSMLGLPANQAFLDGFVATTRKKFTEMSVDELVFTVQALSNFRYRPSNMPAFEDWLHEFSRLAERRRVDARQVCDLVPALSGLPLPPPESLVCTLLTRSRKGRPNSIRHASPRRLANLALSFRAMGFKPDFSFLHLYAQAVRFHWSNFEPWPSWCCATWPRATRQVGMQPHLPRSPSSP
ncbi:hypothetical protein DUNSADRAFT_3002 [Dunaliella salina]|uniref:Uncharacterized protein n=1 Tax=Dunaliella salina TaxID=3046 RepID=A0ABQ7GUN5_DUNSA|nr:hypothetical protein DUNSADRAFT_3002 [Dunaliella salina]|eukprot:KAF5838331.1 hypothetical protein DUNSADRAFT_3002 [Dunaliella salina]